MRDYATSAQFEWKGKGFCTGRHIYSKDDYCNKKTIKGGEYCDECACVIPGCKEKWGSWYPLMPGNPRFCSKHSHLKTKYGCE
jgi:hypothetical protein